jgi:NAD+ synthase
MKEVYEGIVSFLKNYQERTHVKGYVLGISGGKDSTVVAKLLVDSIGKENVLGVLMPNGEQKDINDSIRICEFLNIQYLRVDIESTFLTLLNSIERTILKDSINVGIPNLTSNGVKIIISEKALTNVAPRIRMTILYAIAQSVGYRVAGTSNASELFIGWGTKWGDLASDINPISQLTCSEVISLGDYMGLPYDLIHKTPADGLTGKSDEENFGFTYKELDTLIVKQRNLTCTGRIQCAFTEQELKILKLHEAAYHKDHVIKIHY